MESGGGEEVSIEELASNLSTYKEQLQQVLFCMYTYIVIEMYIMIVTGVHALPRWKLGFLNNLLSLVWNFKFWIIEVVISQSDSSLVIYRRAFGNCEAN